MEPSDPVEVGNISESLFRIEMDKLEITNMRSLNPVLENLAGVKSKGNVYAMDFEINGNDSSATGKVNFQYENFHLDILKNNKKSFFLTTLGNTFLKNKNLEGSKKYRPVNMNLPGFEKKLFSITGGTVSKPVSCIQLLPKQTRIGKLGNEQEAPTDYEKLNYTLYNFTFKTFHITRILSPTRLRPCKSFA